MTDNPYQPFFDKLDVVVVELARSRGEDDKPVSNDTLNDAADLLKRAGYVLANMLNVQATVYPVIILQDEPAMNEYEVEQAQAEDTSGTSVEQPESLAQ